MKPIHYKLIIASLVLIILFLTKCNKEEVIKTVVVKEIVNQTDTHYLPAPVKEQKIIYDTLYEKSISVIRDSLYYEATTLRDYSQTFTDSNISITTNTKVKGTLLSVQNDYKIFERKIDVKTTLPKRNSFYGVVGASARLNNPSPQINIKGILINKKDKMIGAEISTDKSIGVFYGIKF